MTRYTKEDIKRHYDGAGFSRERYYPAVNIKAHHFGDDAPNRDPVAALVAEYHCAEETAEQALRFAWETAQEVFWEDAIDWADECFGPAFGHIAGKDRRVRAEGRSGGWLVVHGSGDVDDWRRFEKGIDAMVADAQRFETIRDNIDANGWAIDQHTREYELGKCLDLVTA